MTRFFLIRHGHTDVIGKRLVSRMPGIELSSRGLAQVNDLVARLALVRLDAIYSSPLERTRATAEALAHPRGLRVQVDEGIHELEFGEWTGKTFEHLDQLDAWNRFNRARSTLRPPGGELLLDVQARMVEAMSRFQAKHRNVNVAVVSHGDPLKALLAYLLGTPLDLFQRIEVEPASVSIVELGEEPRVRRVNDLGAIA